MKVLAMFKLVNFGGEKTRVILKKSFNLPISPVVGMNIRDCGNTFPIKHVCYDTESEEIWIAFHDYVADSDLTINESMDSFVTNGWVAEQTEYI